MWQYARQAALSHVTMQDSRYEPGDSLSDYFYYDRLIGLICHTNGWKESYFLCFSYKLMYVASLETRFA